MTYPFVGRAQKQVQQAPRQTRTTRKQDHRFYTSMACAIAFGVFAGFTPTYYARSIFHSPAIPFWVQVHGAVFTAWMLLYLLQNLLAMNRGMQLHRNLGLLGAFLSGSVFFFGCAIAIRQARQNRSFPFPDLYSMLAISFGQMLLFAVFVSLGLLLRRNTEMHKRLFLMAPMLFFFPSFGRLLHGISPLTLLLALCFYLAGPLYDWITRRYVHPAYRWGVPLLLITMPPLPLLLSRAPLWHRVVDTMIR
jgi:hypothetical protein